jgi:protein required for attachment to host cells
MNAVRLIVVDAARARLYDVAAGTREPRLVSELVNETLGHHERDLVSARAGRVRNSASGQSQPFAARTAARTHAIEAFARHVADWLDGVVAAPAGAPLVLAAEPRMLGLLRPALSERVRTRLVDTLVKDLSHAAPDDLRQSVQHLLGAGAPASGAADGG